MRTKTFKSWMFVSVLVMATLFLPSRAQAQNQIRGNVYDTDKGTPMVGATVLVEGKNQAAITDVDGKFSVRATEGDILHVQFMGYVDQKVPVTKATNYEIILVPDAEALEEVIVTALGMKREKRSLGYAATDVSGDEISQVQNSNWLGGLQGKVAGVQFNTASSGPIGSMKVVVRGESSLSGNSSALFVVDGIPVTSGAISNASGSLYTNNDNPVDFGDGASDINPDDIESITVLKGAAATALYGSRAGNGAIIITTKSGTKTKGLGVTYSSQFTYDHPSYFPDFQKEYGSGDDMGVEEFNFWKGAEGMGSNASRAALGEAFGDGTKMRYQYNSKNWETGELTRTPWVYQEDWYTGLFRNGFTWDNTVTLEGGNGKGTSARLSFKNTKNEWVLPNTGYDKQTISFSMTSKISERIKLNVKANYYRTDSDNMPSSAYSSNSVNYQLMWSWNTNSMKDYYDEYFQGRYNAQNYVDYNNLVAKSNYYNPYRTLYEMTNSMDKDRFFGNAGLTITLAKNLTLDLKTGIDLNYEFRTQRKPKYTVDYPEGMYREQTNVRMEMNSDFMLRYNNEFLNERLTLSAGLGGNNMTYNRNSFKYTITALDVEGVYNIKNYPSTILPDISGYRSNKVVNSLYGILSLGWEDWAYLDLTGRNDWSSTLSKGYNSYFYPSVSGSLVLDKLFRFQENLPAVSFLKLRASWANVGKDTDPYALDWTLSSTDFPGGYRPGGTSPKIDLAPENVETIEAGLEIKLLKNRIGFDVAVYRSNVTNQIYDMPYDYMTGSKYYTQNIGLIRNEGIELAATFVPVKTGDLTWTISANASRNIGKLLKMYDGWNPDTPYQDSYGTTIGSRLFVYDYVGKRMGDMWGASIPQAPEGSYVLLEDGTKADCSGMDIINQSTGLPGAPTATDLKYLGNINPDWTGGLTTTLRYKNFTMGMTFSGQLGGRTYSVTAAILGYMGKTTNTLEGRYDGIVCEGVYKVSTDDDGNGVYAYNKVLCTDIYQYYNKTKWNRYNFEMYTYDTSFIKLKEVRLQYDLPKDLAKKAGFLQGASVAAYATNLFCFSNFPFYDPEAGTMSGSNIKKGIESGSFPMNRSYGLNLKVKF